MESFYSLPSSADSMDFVPGIIPGLPAGRVFSQPVKANARSVASLDRELDAAWVRLRLIKEQ